jgi:hypothetical protein
MKSLSRFWASRRSARHSADTNDRATRPGPAGRGSRNEIRKAAAGTAALHLTSFLLLCQAPAVPDGVAHPAPAPALHDWFLLLIDRPRRRESF